MSLKARAWMALLAAAALVPLVFMAQVIWPLPALLKALELGGAVPDAFTAALIAAGLSLPMLAWLAARWLAPLSRLSRALQGTVLSYRDGDYLLSLAPEGPRELAELLRLHGELGLALREQRQHLAQRELLLDTVVQNTPVALLLTGTSGKVAIANLAARQLLGDGRSLVGRDLTEICSGLPEGLQDALASLEDSLFTVTLADGSEESFHLSQREFRLQGRPHRLRLLRRMTRELSRAEVASWKRVIRVISHELNNSLAPISSLAHSGAALARRGSTDKLPGVFESIGERAAHLHGFLAGYAQFAKLPAPQPAEVAWPGFLAALRAHAGFELRGEPPTQAGWFDAAQIEQALLNLLKNAHEAVGLRIEQVGEELRLEVCDRGTGMSEAVLAQALLPFYSTKRSGSGTGLGLALAREIAEAHGGRIQLANRRSGGLRVRLSLAQRPPAGPPGH